jgi:two-component system chemotaxis response regulator CheY
MCFDVLIVDDSAAIRKILQRMLKQAVTVGILVEAGDGVEAIEAMKANKFNLVMSDINMPNMDGLQLLAQLKAHPEWKHIPVIMVTTEGGEAKVMEAVQLGAAGYVRKPFTADQIKEKLDTLG